MLRVDKILTTVSRQVPPPHHTPNKNGLFLTEWYIINIEVGQNTSYYLGTDRCHTLHPH